MRIVVVRLKTIRLRLVMAEPKWVNHQVVYKCKKCGMVSTKRGTFCYNCGVTWIEFEQEDKK